MYEVGDVGILGTRVWDLGIQRVGILGVQVDVGCRVLLGWSLREWTAPLVRATKLSCE